MAESGRPPQRPEQPSRRAAKRPEQLSRGPQGPEQPSRGPRGPARPPRDPQDPEQLRARIAELEREVAALRESTSFRVGHALVRAAGRLLPRRRPRSTTPRPPATTRRTAVGTGAAAPRDRADGGGQPTSRASGTTGRGARGGTTGRDARGGTTGRDAHTGGPGREARPGPATPTARLLDATGLDAAGAAAAARALRAEGVRLTVVHPDALDLDDLDDLDTADIETVVADEVSSELAARFGPARTLRAVPGAAPRPALLVRDAQPLEQVVDEPGPSEGIPPGPVFIGGTGRSGTWVLGRMFAQHPRFVCINTELRFHATPPGFAGVLSGELTPDEYAEHVHRRWFRPTGGSGAAKGLQLLIGNRELQGLLRRFRERAADDVPGALGQLMLDVTGPYSRGRGALRWAETTPDNARAAAALTTVLPTAQVVHAVRDGRDAAASVAAMPWGPDDHLEGLEWWAGRLREAHAGMDAADPARAHTVRLEELLHLDRDRTLDALLAGLGFTDDELLRYYFEVEMSSGHGHVGRWRHDLDPAQRDAFDGRYRELLAELADEGVTCLPADPDAVDELAEA